MPIWLPIHELNLLYPGLVNYWRCIAKAQDTIKTVTFVTLVKDMQWPQDVIDLVRVITIGEGI